MATAKRPLAEKTGEKPSALSLLWKAHGGRVSCGKLFSSEACGVMYLHCMKLDQQPRSPLVMNSPIRTRTPLLALLSYTPYLSHSPSLLVY